MNVNTRRLKILEMLEQTDSVSVSALGDHFDVSEMTVRRDLDALEERGVLERVRGGARKVDRASYEPPFDIRAARGQAAKEAIGRAAAARINQGETVVLDTGTTALAVADALVERRQITVLTASLRVAWRLADSPGLKVMVIGGMVRPNERSLVGGLAESALDDFYPDRFIMGVGGVDAEQGFTEYNMEDARVKRKAIRMAQDTVVVADREKVGRTAFVRVADVDDVDRLVTDLPRQHPACERLLEAGLAVETVTPEQTT